MDGVEIEMVEHHQKSVRINLSIIIVNYNTEKYLEKCLESIFGFIHNLNFEIIVVDNNSGENVLKVKENFPQVRWIENRKNLGFSSACNQGIKQSSGQYVWLLNPDTEILKGNKSGVEEMIQFMDDHPQVGICGCKMKNPWGEILFSCRSFPSYLTGISSAQSLLNKFFPTNFLSARYLLKKQNRQIPSEVDWVSGSSLLARRKMFEQIGLLDPQFFMYVEDVDLCYRAKKNGWKVYYYPPLEVLHHVGKSTQKKRKLMLAFHHKSMYYFYTKHYSPSWFLKFFIFSAILIRLGWVMATDFLSDR